LLHRHVLSFDVKAVAHLFTSLKVNGIRKSHWCVSPLVLQDQMLEG
jgi:hypothetical protein